MARMDILDKKYGLKKFLKIIFRDMLKNERIRIYQSSKDEKYNKVSFFDDIDNLIDFVINNYNYNNTFFELATTNEKSGREEDLLYRYCLSFDFDKKDFPKGFNHKDILNKFKSLGLWYHGIIDSGNGYHVYIMIDKTDNLKLVNEVQKVLGKLLKADLHAVKKTQLFRLPYTFNVKGEKPKLVKIISMFDKNTVKPYNIDHLYNKFCSNFKELNSVNTRYLLKTNLPICVSNSLENGSTVGNRNRDLYNIVVGLKQQGNNISHVNNIINEWLDKTEDKDEFAKDNLEYQIDYIYKKCSGFRCSECDESIKLKCKNYIVSDFAFEQFGEEIIDIQTKVGRQCRESNRKGVKCMNGNELFIYNVLHNNKDVNLNKEEIEDLITDRKSKKIAISDKTLRDALKGLEEKEYIKVIKGVKKSGIKDSYSLISKKVKEENLIRITYFINIMVIKGHITTSELKCYVRMRYLHHQQVLKGEAKGNIFTITMDALAKDLGVTQPRITKMIKNLYENNILDRRAIAMVDNPKQFYYEYKLNM